MSLSPDDRRYLLRLARESIEHAARGESLPSVDVDSAPEDLRRDGASFVTLNQRGRLRGCIGSLEAQRPLVLDVRKNAVDAALHDPRFPPVQPHEVEGLDIEISVLSAPEALDYETSDELVAKLCPGVDGVVIERGWHRATFLPQVWEKLPDPHEFLQRLCLKAGLAPDVYRSSELDVYIYRVEEFEE